MAATRRFAKVQHGKISFNYVFNFISGSRVLTYDSGQVICKFTVNSISVLWPQVSNVCYETARPNTRALNNALIYREGQQ